MIFKNSKNDKIQQILIIKLGALGDFVLADAAFQAIRDHFPKAHITLLTTPTFHHFAQKLGHFDHIIVRERFSLFHFSHLKSFIKWIRGTSFDFIFDLQMVDRTKFYFYLFKIFAKDPFRWVGHIRSSSYFLEDVYFKKHPKERFARLLSKVEIEKPGVLDLRRIACPIDIPGLGAKFILLIPGASNAFGGAKKWPLEKYRELIATLTVQDFDVVIIGGPGEDHSTLKVNDRVFDITGKTSFEQIIYIASRATAALGGDTGPMHMAASAHCPIFVLFSKKALPAEQVGAISPHYIHLTAPDLKALEVDEVRVKFTQFLEEVQNHSHRVSFQEDQGQRE